jgi:hypothetical protein
MENNEGLIILLCLLIGIILVVVSVNGKKNKEKLETERKTNLLNEFDSLKDQIKDSEGLRKELITKSADEFEKNMNNIKRQLYLFNKYGQEEGMKMYKGEYWIGMTEEQIIDAKGQPTKVETEVLKTKTKRILIYGNKNSGDVFSFVNGTLEHFKDR